MFLLNCLPSRSVRAARGSSSAVAAAMALVLAAVSTPAMADGYLWIGREENPVITRFNLATSAVDLSVDMTVPLGGLPPSNMAIDGATLYLGTFFGPLFAKADAYTGIVTSTGSYTGAPAASNYEDGSWNPATDTLWRTDFGIDTVFECDLNGNVLSTGGVPNIYLVTDTAGGGLSGIYGSEWAMGLHFITAGDGRFGSVTISGASTATFHPLSLTGLTGEPLALAYDRDANLMYLTTWNDTNGGFGLYSFDLASRAAVRVADLPGICDSLGWVAPAGPFDNSLWLGTDNTANNLPVLNTDRSGHELRRVDVTEATGIAIDPAANRIYFSDSDGRITARNLNDPGTILVTLDTAANFTEDMAFDGASLWRVDHGAQSVDRIDPSNGIITFSFDPGFLPLGLAWDGTHLWVSEFTVDGLVKQFTTTGVGTGNQFNAPLEGNVAGGLAFDTTDNTLWIGTSGHVYHTTTAGALLGSFIVNGPFVDGLEFQGVGPCRAPVFTQQPQNATACPGGSAPFSVTVTGTGPLTYQWQIETAPGVWQTLGNDPFPLPCGGGAFAYATPINSPAVHIGIHPCPGVTHVQVRAVVTNDCGSATSGEAAYSICPADFNCSGTVNSQDFFDFLTAFFTFAPAADFNHDGTINSQDFFDFLTAFFGGC